MEFHKIFLAEGNPQVKKEITELFFRRGDIKILGEATSAQELYANEKVYGADIVLLDLHLDAEPNNRLINHILYRNHRIDVIALQENDWVIDLYSLISDGYKGVVRKNKIHDELDQAMARVINHGFFIPNDLYRTTSSIMGKTGSKPSQSNNKYLNI